MKGDAVEMLMLKCGENCYLNLHRLTAESSASRKW